MNDKMELEESINILRNKIYSLNENIKIYDKGYDLSNKDRFIKEKEAIETVLQALKNRDKDIKIYEKNLDDTMKILEDKNKIKEHCKILIKEKQKLTSDLLDSIPKKKIKDKIEKLEILEKNCNTSVLKMQYLCKINILQELLEEK